MAMYSDLTDEELAAKITELRGKVETVAGGGAVAVIAGEGRRKEFTRGNIGDLRALLTEAVQEAERRANGGRLRGRAIGVRFI
jgi:hypothetical protein